MKIFRYRGTIPKTAVLPACTFGWGKRFLQKNVTNKVSWQTAHARCLRECFFLQLILKICSKKMLVQVAVSFL
jgi:hypothetical protein